MHVAGPLSLPTWWPALILALAAFRLTRLIGWDEWPPAARSRAWLIGEHWVPAEPVEGAEKPGGRVDAAELGVPGKQPASLVSEVRPAYRRPTLAHLVHCPWCLGAYVSSGVYGFWLWQPKMTLFVLVPWAVSAFVGLVAKNLDP